MLHGFLLFSVVKLWSFWYCLKGLFTLHKLADKVVLEERTWIRTGGYGWLRGEWVKKNTFMGPIATLT